jgi:hypothetical protein
VSVFSTRESLIPTQACCKNKNSVILCVQKDDTVKRNEPGTEEQRSIGFEKVKWKKMSGAYRGRKSQWME